MNTNPSDSDDIDALGIQTRKMPNLSFRSLYVSDNHFRELEGEEPLPTNVLPNKQQIEIKGWRVHIKYGECYMPMIENGSSPVLVPHSTYVWCQQCRIWIKTSGTMGNINAHYCKTKKHPQYGKPDENQVHEATMYTEEQKRAAAKRFIVRNGLAKRLIEDPDLKILVSGLPGRKSFTSEITEEADTIRSKIKDILATVDTLSLSMDEWTSLSNNRYLGITCSTFYSGDMLTFSIEHIPLVIDEDAPENLGIKAGDVGSLVQDTIIEYDIDEKITNVVTDNASLMKAGLQFINNQRRLQDAGPYLWTPCVCHTLNLIVAAFLEEISPFILQIKNLQKKLGKSANFTQFLINKERKITRLPSYVKIRWYSLYKLVKAISVLKFDIIQYYNEKLHESVDEETLNIATNLRHPLYELKRYTLTLESSSFGTISVILFSFYQIKKAFGKLSNIFPEAIESFNAKYEEILRSFKDAWGPILFAASILNPRLRHLTYMSGEEWESGMEWLRTKVNEQKAKANRNITEDVASLNSQDPSAYVANQVPRVALNRRPIRPNQVRARANPRNQIENDNPPHNSDLDRMVDDAQNQEIAIPEEFDELNDYIGNYIGKNNYSFQMWNRPYSELPNLQAVAQKVLSILTSSASTERQFSKSRRVLGYQRLKLLPSHVEDETIIVGNPNLTNESFE